MHPHTVPTITHVGRLYQSNDWSSRHNELGIASIQDVRSTSRLVAQMNSQITAIAGTDRACVENRVV